MFCSFPMGLLFCSAASAMEAAMDPRAPMELSPATPNSARSIRRISARSKASATASVISHNWAWSWEMLGRILMFLAEEKSIWEPVYGRNGPSAMVIDYMTTMGFRSSKMDSIYLVFLRISRQHAGKMLITCGIKRWGYTGDS